MSIRERGETVPGHFPLTLRAHRVLEVPAKLETGDFQLAVPKLNMFKKDGYKCGVVLVWRVMSDDSHNPCKDGGQTQ